MEKITLSHSQLSVARECARKYRYMYVQRRVPAREGAERPGEQRDHEEEGEAARDTMGELDRRLEAGRARHDLSVARRPVLAAARAGPGRPDEGAPGHHGEAAIEGSAIDKQPVDHRH